MTRSLTRGVLLLALLWTAAAPALRAQKLRDGYIVTKELTTGEQQFYYFRLDADSTILLRQGLDEQGPSFELPFVLARTIQRQLDQLAPPDSSGAEGFGFSYRNRILNVTLATLVDRLAWMTAAVFALFLGLLLLWFRRRLAQERQAQWRLLESRRGLAQSREDERRRLAQELHDGPIQDLHAIRMQLTMPAPPAPGGADELQEQLARVARELRMISEDLRPPALGPFGLSAALTSLVDRFRQRNPGLEVHAELARDEQQLPERTRLALFRICQEALSNAARHARAGHVWIRFTLDARAATLEVRDDGSGFTVPAELTGLAADGHYGLLGMSERAESVGADLEILSAPEAGMCLRVRAPRPDREPGAGMREPVEAVTDPGLLIRGS